ncbi:MAG TPA: hypothetical protein VK642_13245 [Burkholderiales bacterium]|nr:hypothetical protein [Burkholderiales bacterium]
MEAGTAGEQATGKRGRGPGRRNKDGSDEVIKIGPIKEACAELMTIYKKFEIAKDDWNRASKVVAERGSVNTSSLKKLIKSSADGKFEDTRRAIEQQGVLFEGVGEVSASGAAN